MTLYQELKDAGCELDSHESDLYVLATAKAMLIVTKHPVGYSCFIGNDGKRWLDLPFMYSPWWEHKKRA